MGNSFSLTRVLPVNPTGCNCNPTSPFQPQPVPVPLNPVSPFAPVQPIQPSPFQPVQPSPFQPIQPSPFQPTPFQPIQPSPFQPIQPTPFQPIQPEPIQSGAFSFFQTPQQESQPFVPWYACDRSPTGQTTFNLSRIGSGEIAAETEKGVMVIPTDQDGKICLNLKMDEQSRCYIQMDGQGTFYLLENGGKDRKKLRMDGRNCTPMCIGPDGVTWFNIQQDPDQGIIEGMGTREHDGNKGKYRTCHRKEYKKKSHRQGKKDRYTWIR